MYLYFVLAIGMTLSTALAAQSAVFEGRVLKIPGVGVVDGTNHSFYGDVELSYEGDGVFRMLRGGGRTLVSVEEISIVLSPDNTQAVVTAEGFKSNPCVSLEWPSISKLGDEFNIVIAQTTLGPAETCVAILDPYTRSVTLELSGQLAGTYSVRVNGRRVEFSLPVDVP